jgi:HD-GYP domain-containing protein (c-di-GMP phosphodiesterase class II)
MSEKAEIIKNQYTELWQAGHLSATDASKINDQAVLDSGVWLEADYGYIVSGMHAPFNTKLHRLLAKWHVEKVYVGQCTSSLFKENVRGGESLSDEEAGLMRAGSTYAHIYQSTVDFYDRYKSKRTIDLSEIGSIIRDMIELINTDRRFALRFNDFDLIREEYFIAHAVETTMLSIVVGKVLRLVPHRLMYLGISCFLHEIGLLHMPPEIMDESRPLSPKEKEILSKHTILGYTILKPLGLDREIMQGVLQHHERSDGSGYSQGLSGEEISLFAKIIGVTCSYHAQIFDRDFKKSKSGHSSLIDLLNSLNSKYDSTIIKILLQELSIFPLGSGVSLTDGSIGIIMDVDPVDPRRPTAKIVVDKDGKLTDGSEVIRIGNEVNVKHVLSNSELQELKVRIRA